MRTSSWDKLLNEFFQFENDRNINKKCFHLENALSFAANILSDVEAQQLHDKVRKLVQDWFRRIKEQLELAFKNDEESLELYFHNYNHFNNPIFEIEPINFDEEEKIEMEIIYRRSPQARSTFEQQRLNQYFSKLVGIPVRIN